MRLRLRDNFIAGIAVILPFMITIWVLAFFIEALTASVLDPLLSVIGPYLVNRYLVIGARVVMFIIVLLVIYLVGLGTRILFVRKLFSLGDDIVYRLPMVGRIYVGIKQLSNAFLGRGKGIFHAAVLVEYPRKGVYSIGFVVKTARGEVQDKTKQNVVSVFMATAPNPTSGFVILVPEQDIIPLDMSVEEAMKLVISGGAVAPQP